MMKRKIEIEAERWMRHRKLDTKRERPTKAEALKERDRYQQDRKREAGKD
jgi:hypothetical protein